MEDTARRLLHPMDPDERLLVTALIDHTEDATAERMHAQARLDAVAKVEADVELLTTIAERHHG